MVDGGISPRPFDVLPTKNSAFGKCEESMSKNSCRRIHVEEFLLKLFDNVEEFIDQLATCGLNFPECGAVFSPRFVSLTEVESAKSDSFLASNTGELEAGSLQQRLPTGGFELK